jgi:hypothetical protein
MRYIKTFENFTESGTEEKKFKDFFEWFELIDISSFDDEIKKFVNRFVKLFGKGKIDDIVKEYPDYERRMKDAYEEYNKEELRLALPQGDLQSSTPELPKVEIDWGKE